MAVGAWLATEIESETAPETSQFLAHVAWTAIAPSQSAQTLRRHSGAKEASRIRAQHSCRC